MTTPITPPVTLPQYRLKFTNRFNETYYFVRLGGRWDAHPKWDRGPDAKGRRFIERTTSNVGEATVFDALPDAFAVLVDAGDPADWVVETLDGRAVG